MTRLLAALGIVLLANTARADVWLQSLPPPKYSGPYRGTLTERILPLGHPDFLVCRSHACAIPRGDHCTILLPAVGKLITPAHQRLIRQHEIGHCNGWPGTHPDARKVQISVPNSRLLNAAHQAAVRKHDVAKRERERETRERDRAAKRDRERWERERAAAWERVDRERAAARGTEVVVRVIPAKEPSNPSQASAALTTNAVLYHPAPMGPPQHIVPARMGSQHIGPILPRDAQRVVLYEEDPADPSGKRFIGSAIWRTETVTPAGGQAPDLAVRCDVEIPERQLALTMAIRRNSDQALPASHTIEIMFNLPADFPFGGISNVPGMLMKQAEATRGAPLSGLAVKVTSGFFLLGLSAVDTEAQRNLELLRERSWFDIPVVYNNGRRAIIAVEKGNPGERAFNEAFTVWGRPRAASPRRSTQ